MGLQYVTMDNVENRQYAIHDKSSTSTYMKWLRNLTLR